MAAFGGLPRYIVEWGLGPRAASFAPLFAEMLLELGGEEMDGEGHLNDGVVLCRALGSMRPAARGAAEAIRAAGEWSTHPEAKAAAEEALKAIGSRPSSRCAGGVEGFASRCQRPASLA